MKMWVEVEKLNQVFYKNGKGNSEKVLQAYKIVIHHGVTWRRIGELVNIFLLKKLT